MHRKSVSNAVVANGITHAMSAGMAPPKLKNHYPPAISVVTFSADVAQLYRGQTDPEKMEDFEELSTAIDENSGFAIVINGHSLIHCLTPELEMRLVIFDLCFLFIVHNIQRMNNKLTSKIP